MSGGSFGKGKQSGSQSGTQTSNSQVHIPDFLWPLIDSAQGNAREAMGTLDRRLSGQNDLAADLTPDQLAAFEQARQFATGANGILPTAQNAALQAAQGGLNQGSMNFLQQALRGGAAGGGMSAIANALKGNPTAQGTTAINQALRGGVPDSATQALTQTAQGDFLHGGAGFNAAVDAATRAAQPGILSTFGSGGVGAGTGGLAQTAIAQSAHDAFARQFAQERQNQLGAANSLGSLGLAGQGQQINAGGLLANIGLANRGQQIDAGGLLGSLGLSDRGQQISSAGLLGDLGLAGQSQQLQAAGMLPGLGTIGSNVLSQIGGQQQAQDQAEIDAPINAQMQKLMASLGLPAAFASLFGQSSQGTQSGQYRGKKSEFGLSFEHG